MLDAPSRTEPPGDNAIYRRDRLAGLEDLLDRGFWEAEIHRGCALGVTGWRWLRERPWCFTAGADSGRLSRNDSGTRAISARRGRRGWGGSSASHGQRRRRLSPL